VIAGDDARPRPLNRTGRRRVVVDGVRLWLSAVALGASLVLGYTVWGIWRVNPASLAAPAESMPLREIAVRTDGVLGHAWVERTLQIAPGTGIMELDLPALRQRLLASGQVRDAVVTRRFPDVLAAILEERSPVIRARVQTGEGELNNLFVARDGSVFFGERYDESLVNSLPWLGGVNLSRAVAGPGFAPVAGMEAVSELLGTTRASAPALARDFQVISLARYASDGVLLVRTPEIAEIVFGTRDDFYRQLARLDYILDELRSRPGSPAIRTINLAIGGQQVPVAFEPASSAAATAPAVRPVTRPLVAPAQNFFRL
jgi:cell division protein FtsQ